MQWLTHEELIEQRNISIGFNPDTYENTKIIDFNMGDAYAVFGMTGYGKSLLAGNLLTEFAKRRILIFDYKGDYRNLKYINIHNKHNKFKSLYDLIYLHRFGFKLQDFTNPFDWEMLGMTTNGANLCASKAKQVPYHKNDINIFREMIEEVETFGKGRKGEAWLVTKQSVLAKLNNIKGAFITNDCVDVTNADFDEIRYKGKPFYVSDWRKFLRRHKHVCLNMNSEFSVAKAQLMCGKILNDIEPAMEELNLVICIEEAHKLCPENVAENVPYSLIKILHYLKELHKKGVKLILISQYPHQMQDEVLDEIKRFFIGRLQNIKGHSKLDEMFKMSNALEFNYINDYREFWHYSPLYNERCIFVPYDSYTIYQKRR